MSYAPQQRANVPSRTGPVILIVAGALAMILGPIIGIVMSVSNLFGAVDWQGFTDTQQITNGSTADLAANAEWMVVPSSGAQGYSCDVTGTNGEMVDTRSREGVITFTSTQAGPYSITCDSGGDTLIVMPAANLDEMLDNAPGAFSSFAVGLLVGFLGFVALIVGIIWLVRVNRERRESGGGGYPPPGWGAGGYGAGGYTQGGYGGYGQGGQGAQGGQGSQQGSSNLGQWGGQSYTPPPPGPSYGQNPSDPPRYGERIDPQDPPR